MKFNILRFPYYPYIKSNLIECKFPLYLKESFKKSYDNLPYDKYVDNGTRKRRYANYLVKNNDNSILNNDSILNIIHTGKNTFKQNVSDSRGEIREFELIENPLDPFLLNFVKMASQMTYKNHNESIKNLSVDVHQVRQITYNGIEAHNSPEGIHQDGCDYIISACVLNRHNINGGISTIYNLNKESIYRTILTENEFIFQDDRNLYHYVSPVNYLLYDSIEPYGYRDIIGLDINII
tara:strand:+ start:1268 stop:1978 length:711 start_codon:yes stop_codon:yes gene_type:complete